MVIGMSNVVETVVAPDLGSILYAFFRQCFFVALATVIIQIIVVITFNTLLLAVIHSAVGYFFLHFKTFIFQSVEIEIVDALDADGVILYQTIEDVIV